VLSYHPLVLYDIKSPLTKSFQTIDGFGEKNKIMRKKDNVIRYP